MAPFTPLFIDGREVPASDNATFEVYNTSVSTVVGTSASASSADCDAAVEAAGRAFKSWEKTTPYARRDIFLKAAELAETDRWRELTQRTAQEETACSAVWAQGSSSVGSLLRTVGSFANELTGKTFMSASIPGMQCVMEPRAMGVV
jgi:acyl-CoA reductase-like NAD-dependent aldehyde dehydrogenase